MSLQKPEPQELNLREFFAAHRNVAVAFSGGVDSSYLLYAAGKWAARVTGYYVHSQFQPAFELDDAKSLAEEIGVDLRILEVDVLQLPSVTDNPPDRCYYCKQAIFSAIMKAAREDGFQVILDGTNASDDAGDRPGMRALDEMHVLSPLRMCRMTKEDVRDLSREAGLFTWNKPSYACLATRIPAGTKITQEALSKTEAAECFLAELGLRDFRVRMTPSGGAILQILAEDMALAIACREQILGYFAQHYSEVMLDLKARPHS